MDFRRIELCFLVVFIMLDIFLFSSYHQSQRVVVNSTGNEDTQLVSEMKVDDDISFKKLSNKKHEGYYISVNEDQNLKAKADDIKNQRLSYEGNAVIGQLKIPVNYKKTGQKYLDDFVKNSANIAYGKRYTFNRYLSDSHQKIYSQKLGDIGETYSENAQITFYVENGQISEYRQTHVINPQILREKQLTISEKDAIFTLYNGSEIPKNTEIVWSKLKYSELLSAKGSVIYIPTWYVCLKNKSTKNRVIKRVNAFNRSIMKDSNGTV